MLLSAINDTLHESMMIAQNVIESGRTRLNLYYHHRRVFFWFFIIYDTTFYKPFALNLHYMIMKDCTKPFTHLYPALKT